MVSEQVSLNKSELDFFRKMCLNSFHCFCQAIMPEEWFDESFHGDLCDFLQHDPALDKLIVLPRTHLKTTIGATMYPLWCSTKAPNTERTLIAGNSADNASMTVHEIKGIVTGNTLYRALFPDVLPNVNSRSAKWSDSQASLRREKEWPEATFEGAGIGSNIIRRHYTRIIEDDTVAPKRDELSGEELLPSREEIEKAIGFHKLTLPLLITYERDERIFIATRWAAYDAVNHILEHESNPTKLRHYSIFNRKAIHPETGQPLYKRFSLAALDSIRDSMGSYMFSSLYLNEPLSSEFMKFRPEWTRFYEESELPEDGLTYVTVDPADPPTGKSTQCFSVALSAKHTKHGIYVRRYRRGRYTDSELINHTFDIAEQDGAIRIRIEVDRYPHLAAGFKLAMAKRGVHFIIEEVKTRGRNKEARIMRLTPLFENGVVFLKKGMKELETEMYQFPRGGTKDILDALSWQVLENFQAPSYEKPKERVVSDYSKHTFEQIMDSLKGHRGRVRREVLV